MRTFSEEEKQFMQEHVRHDAAQLMLQANRYPHLPMLELVQQIQARQKAMVKLPTWAANPDAVFPVTLSVEQSSSETTAAYKASLVQGALLVDLTGGFGTDSLYFAKRFEQVIHVEQNLALQQIAKYNFKLLQTTNIQSIATTAEEFLQEFKGKADVLYLDPARRGGSNQKLHLLEECEPAILSLLPLLFAKADAVLLKTSPMLDIDLALEQLQHVAKVWVVAVQNEVKEVLYFLQPHKTLPALVPRTAVNLLSETQPDLVFTKAAEEAAHVTYTDPQHYIYEPNAAILKAGAYRYLSEHLRLHKLHPNSHLYTSQELVADFPGRTFCCSGVSRYSKKEIWHRLPGKQANITVRNFPESVAAIRQKTSIKEGGDNYLFFTTDRHQKAVVLYCHKV